MRSGSRELVEFLIGRGCDPLVCCGYTALSLAAVMGHLSLVQYFLAHGVDPNIRDRVGFTALGHAAKEGHADIVETLLAWGVQTEILEENEETALSWAVKGKHEKVVDLLLQNGAHPSFIQLARRMSPLLGCGPRFHHHIQSTLGLRCQAGQSN